MSHKVLINGTAYGVAGGNDLKDGTKYQIGGGRTLINGTGYEIKFRASGYTMRITGSGGQITYNGIAQIETFTVQPGDSISITVTAIFKPLSHDFGNRKVESEIYINSEVVKKATANNDSRIVSATYIYTPTSGATIYRNLSSEAGGTAESISIIEDQ